MHEAMTTTSTFATLSRCHFSLECEGLLELDNAGWRDMPVDRRTHEARSAGSPKTLHITATVKLHPLLDNGGHSQEDCLWRRSQLQAVSTELPSHRSHR